MYKFIKNEYLINLLMFIFGGIAVFLLTFVYEKEKVMERIVIFKGKLKRFLYNITSQISIIIAFAIIYKISVAIGYESDMLSNLIGAGLSIFIIDFLHKERELNKKKELSELLRYKIKEIIGISNKMLLKYIDFKDYKANDISKDLLVNIIAKQNLLTETVEIMSIKDTGEVCQEKVPKIDYPFYIARELNPLLTQLISNYGQYLDHDQIIVLIELDGLLDKNIFKSRISTINGINDSVFEGYIPSFVDALERLNNIVKKLETRS